TAMKTFSKSNCSSPANPKGIHFWNFPKALARIFLTRLVAASLRESSVRNAMFIVNVPGDSQAPLGAACDDAGVMRRPMPLLTELEPDSVGRPFYKHGAPSGACAEARRCSAIRENRTFCTRFLVAASPPQEVCGFGLP